jgi:hypothetical protein
MSFSSRIRAEARDFLEVVLAPGIAAVLPWRLCFRLFKFLCRSDFLYRDPTERAFDQARARGWAIGDPDEWRQSRRLVTLIDHADFYLAISRTDRWIARHVQVSGRWPEADRGAALLCTFHWGAGMWGLRSAGAHGLHARALIAAHRKENFVGHSVQYWYYGWRNRAVAASLRREPIEVSAPPRRIVETLKNGERVLGVIDVPSDRSAACCEIEILGRRAFVPRGLLRIAADMRIPVTVYLTGIRMSDGVRTLEIVSLAANADVDDLIKIVFSILDQAIRRDPAAWHFWMIAPALFNDACATE